MPILAPVKTHSIKRSHLNFPVNHGGAVAVNKTVLSTQDNLYIYRTCSTAISAFQAVYTDTDLAYIADLTGTPAVGIAVESKSESELVKILVIGIIETNLTLDEGIIYLGSSGEIITELPALTEGHFIQILGTSLNNSTIIINPNSQIIYKQ